MSTTIRVGSKFKILIYVDEPMCSIACADAVYDILQNQKQFSVKSVGPSSWDNLKKLNKKTLKDCDCIVFPGGDGNSDQFDNNLINQKKLIRNYVLKGGRYMGICMGGYFASDYYFDILRNISAVRYIKRKMSDTRTQAATKLRIKWKDKKKYWCYYHDGAAFILDTVCQTPNIYARYLNGDIAALTTSFGLGKVCVVGPHLEAPKWWFYTQSKFNLQWKNCIQHDLFLEMFNDLIYDKTTRS